MYLDELCLELEEIHKVSAATSTIWRTLVKGGYSMKRHVTKPIVQVYLTNHTFSSPTQPLNEVPRRDPYLQLGLEHMSQTSLFLLTKVPLIIIQHTEDGHGRYMG